jgi:hypothetical protein
MCVYLVKEEDKLLPGLIFPRIASGHSKNGDRKLPFQRKGFDHVRFLLRKRTVQ